MLQFEWAVLHEQVDDFKLLKIPRQFKAVLYKRTLPDFQTIAPSAACFSVFLLFSFLSLAQERLQSM